MTCLVQTASDQIVSAQSRLCPFPYLQSALLTVTASFPFFSYTHALCAAHFFPISAFLPFHPVADPEGTNGPRMPPNSWLSIKKEQVGVYFLSLPYVNHIAVCVWSVFTVYKQLKCKTINHSLTVKCFAANLIKIYMADRPRKLHLHLQYWAMFYSKLNISKVNYTVSGKWVTP